METKEFSTKKDNNTLREIREAILAGNRVIVNNLYETVYGVDFDHWLKEGLKDLSVTYEVTSWCHFEYRYPWTYVITPNTNN